MRNATRINEYRYVFDDWRAWQQLAEALDRMEPWPNKEIDDAGH